MTMGRIRAVDLRFLDDVFASDRGAGYVLDFTDRTFSDFFRSELQINIDDQKYCREGTSKGKRLRAFLQIESDTTVGRALRALWEYREAIASPSSAGDDKAARQQERFFALVSAMDGKGGVPRSTARQPSPTFFCPPTQALAALNTQYLTLMSMDAHSRGFALEKFLADLFALYELDPRRSFRLRGEQIDGSFDLHPEIFLVEAKWQAVPTGQSDLLAFSGKVEGKAQWSRGMFISYSGFSEDGLHAFARGRPTSIVCMDGLDLHQILSGGLNLTEVIQKKKRRAAETGNAFVPVRDLFNSVS
jgi:Restriction endonuclease